MLQKLSKTFLIFMVMILQMSELFEGSLQNLKLESLAWKMNSRKGRSSNSDENVLKEK